MEEDMTKQILISFGRINQLEYTDFFFFKKELSEILKCCL